MALLYCGADDERAQRWAALFAAQAPEFDFRCWPDIGDPGAIRYLLAWHCPSDLAQRFPALEVVFATSAGVDQFDLAQIPAAIPVVRMFDPSIRRGMVEYACFAALYLHRDIHRYTRQQAAAVWHQHLPVDTASRCVGILGLGHLGGAIAGQLRDLGFAVAGWSRTPREIDGVRCFAGAAERASFLAASDILICVLPLTRETRGILNAELFHALPPGTAVVNIGRGGHLVEADLLAALDTGKLSAAVVDVLATEPPAADHPFWRHERILLTPHVAALTNPDTAFPVLLANLRRHQHGETLVGIVDRAAGY